MNFFAKNMLFNSVPFTVHFTEVDSIKGEKLVVLTSDFHDSVNPFNTSKKSTEWSSVNAPGLTALFFRDEERFCEQ